MSQKAVSTASNQNSAKSEKNGEDSDNNFVELFFISKQLLSQNIPYVTKKASQDMEDIYFEKVEGGKKTMTLTHILLVLYMMS